MKKPFKLANALLGLTVLFVVLFQSLHSFEHLAKQFSEESCIHKYSEKATLNHSHYWEKCRVCEFAFSNYTVITFKEIVFFKTPVFGELPFNYSNVKIPFYSGSFFSLRGPPNV